MVEGMMAFFAALGFAMIFHVPYKERLYSGLVGMAGGLTYKLLFPYLGTASLFMASLIVSLLAEIFARIRHFPTSIYLLCALVPLVPGGSMYYTVLTLFEKNYAAALSYGLDVLSSAVAIVMGCTLIAALFKMKKRRLY